MAAENLRTQKLHVLSLLLYSIAISAMDCHELPKLCNRALCTAQWPIGYILAPWNDHLNPVYGFVYA